MRMKSVLTHSGEALLEGLLVALLVVGLMPPEKGQVYQLWVWDTQVGILCPCGTFATLPDGHGVWTFIPPEPLTPNLRFGVTREPEGGSPFPTGPMLISGNLPGQPSEAPPYTASLD